MAGVRYGRRRQTIKVTGEGEAGEVDGDRKRSGEQRTPYRTSCFHNSGTETRYAKVGE